MALQEEIATMLGALAGKHRVPIPEWDWTPRNSHFKPLTGEIFIAEYYADTLLHKPQFEEDVLQLVTWEVCHLFKHYLDQKRFRAGNQRGSRVLPHIERKRWVVYPRFEEDADIYATKCSQGMDIYAYEELKRDLWKKTYELFL